MAEKGIRCSLECEDRDGTPRYCTPGSDIPICSTCRANMGGWLGRLLEARRYETQLEIRKRRIAEVNHPTAGSWVARLKARRRRLAHA